MRNRKGMAWERLVQKGGTGGCSPGGGGRGRRVREHKLCRAGNQSCELNRGQSRIGERAIEKGGGGGRNMGDGGKERRGGGGEGEGGRRGSGGGAGRAWEGRGGGK